MHFGDGKMGIQFSAQIVWQALIKNHSRFHHLLPVERVTGDLSRPEKSFLTLSGVFRPMNRCCLVLGGLDD